MISRRDFIKMVGGLAAAGAAAGLLQKRLPVLNREQAPSSSQLRTKASWHIGAEDLPAQLRASGQGVSIHIGI